MKTVVAIGGGEIGRPGYPVETTAIDKEIMRLAGKKKPRVLFVPTASSDSVGYVDTVHKHFGNRLGCVVDVLYLMGKKLTEKELKQKIAAADIIYVGGGNTAMMIRLWRKFGVDKLLRRAYERGAVVSGMSAGSICWFRYGISDSRRFKNPKAPLIRVSGLNIINATHSPHFDEEKEREVELKKMMKKTPGVAIAIDNCCALVLQDNMYRVINSKPGAKAYKLYWSRGKYHKEEIEKVSKLKPLADLLKKV